MTIDDVIARLPRPDGTSLPAPAYAGSSGEGTRVALAVEGMARHSTDEGMQVMLALQHAGYILHGADIGEGLTDVREIVRRENPSTVLIQDKREWMGLTADRRQDPRIRFRNVDVLRERPDIFRTTFLKDAQNDRELQREAAIEAGIHAHITYYNTRVIHHLAPYTRPNHLIRTYHSVDAAAVPPYTPEGRASCILSGAISRVYPLRQRLAKAMWNLPGVTLLKHPGYASGRCHTPSYLQTLSGFKVSICTASIYGFALRKVIESVACGCIVVTDLPVDEVLPEIDSALVRIDPSISIPHLSAILRRLYAKYDPEKQEYYAGKAKAWYDFRSVGLRLAADIETLRRNYP